MKHYVALARIAASTAVVAVRHDSKAERDLAVGSAKQLALGTLMYTQDWDDRFPATESQVAGTYPYLKNLRIFMPFPHDKPATVFTFDYGNNPHFKVKSAFVFNPNLHGKLVSAVHAPATTVLWSYGSRKHLAYAFNGRTLVAYADGHVKLVGKADAKNLRWTP